MNSLHSITLVGAGNLATHLGRALVNSGYKISQVFSLSDYKARKLAYELNSEFITQLEQVDRTSDLIVLAVKDDKVTGVADFIGKVPGIVVHVSGSVPIEALAGAGDDKGVIYPLQTFSVDRQVDFGEVSVCLEASNEQTRIKLRNLANTISRRVFEVDSDTRRKLHMAAVFINNFPNHLYYIAEEMAKETGVPFDILKPLALETVAKAFDLSPKDAQTGPAKRGEETVMQRHLQLLDEHPMWQEIYRMISDSIVKLYHRED
ncbi:MAG: Rossmann-like and DUF2520 domain-containing protein [Bacteroidia bacterium]